MKKEIYLSGSYFNQNRDYVRTSIKICDTRVGYYKYCPSRTKSYDDATKCRKYLYYYYGTKNEAIILENIKNDAKELNTTLSALVSNICITKGEVRFTERQKIKRPIKKDSVKHITEIEESKKQRLLDLIGMIIIFAFITLMTILILVLGTYDVKSIIGGIALGVADTLGIGAGLYLLKCFLNK